MGAVLDALSAYTERHLARMDRLRRSVCLLDYTLGCMHVIEETALKVCNMHEITSFWLVVRKFLFSLTGLACILGCSDHTGWPVCCHEICRPSVSGTSFFRKGMQVGEDEEAAAAAEESEQHSSESDLTPSGRFQQQQEVSGTGPASALDMRAILVHTTAGSVRPHFTVQVQVRQSHVPQLRLC